MSLLSIVTYPSIASAQGSFTFSFSYINGTDIDAFVDGVKVFENNASTGTAVGGNTYTVTFSSPGSNTLTFTPNVPAGSDVRIERNTDLTTKEVDFSDGSVLTEVALDNAVDQVFFAAQEAIDKTASTITEAPDGKWDAQSKVIKNLADPVNNTDAVNKQFISTNLPNITTVAGISQDVTDVAGIASDVTAVAADASDIGTVSTNISSVNTVATNINDVITVANDLNEAISEIETAALDLQDTTSDIDVVSNAIANVNAVGNDITSVNTTATNIANVNTTAGSITNVNAVGTDITNVNTVATDITNVNAVANNSTNINTVAGIDTDVSTVAGIQADVTTVANDGTDIGTVATNIASVNTVASNNANVTAVANDATDIGTVATNIANVNAVGTDITNVNTVASNLTNVNSFAETYYVSATEPNNTTVGDLWFDTTADVMKVKASGGFVNAGSSVNGTSQRQVYTAGTASGSYDGNSLTTFPVTYDAGFVDIFLNGVKMQVGTDVTATSGTDIIFATAVSSGDVVDIVSFGTFELSTTELDDLVGVSVPSPSNGNVLKYNGTNWVASSADVVDDTSPQLGADLDGNTFSIDLTSATDSMGVPVGTTAQEPSPTAGHIRYDTDKGVLTYADGSIWKKVSAEIPLLNSASGNIYAGVGTTLTLTGDKFLSANLVVNFLQSADNINEDVTVTPTSNTSASVAVPSAVFSNVTSGNVVTIKVTNSDGGISGGVTKTALALPTGGTVTTVNGFRVHQINSTSNFVIPTGVSLTADYIVVAGGAGGGGWGGGGGAGGVIEVTNQAMTAGTFQANIGGGGAGGTSAYTAGVSGNPSSFNGTTATGGGYGGHYDPASHGIGSGNGGSGGGGAMGTNPPHAGGSGTSGQGNNGGSGGGQDGSGNWTRAGGGGGKGGAGTNGSASSSDTGNGGVGVDYSTNYGNMGHGGYLGGGGGGHCDARSGLSRSSGGQGGGGAGGSYHDTNGSLQLSGVDGIANTGGGGGGGYGDGGSMDTGVGGSGTVLIRYQLS